MPRPVKEKAPEPPNSMISSAARVTTRRTKMPKGSTQGVSQPWQDEGWHFLDCADHTTEILTLDGWVTHDQLTEGILVRTLDHETGTTAWEPVERVARHPVVDVPMQHLTMRHHDSLTTLHHRWPVLRMGYDGTGRTSSRRTGRRREWTVSSDLRAEDQIITAAPARDLPSDAKHSDTFVALVAWFWTEGTIRRNRRSPSVTISQSTIVNAEHCATIERLLDDYAPGSWRCWVNPDNGVAQYALTVEASAALVEAAPDKRVRRDFLRSLTLAQLHLFLDTSMAADGHRRGSGAMIGQKHPDMLEAYEYACILAGRTPHTTTDRTQDRSLLFDLPRQTATPRRARNRTVETYTGTVWCPVTPSKTWLARRNGTVFYTGNTVGELAFANQWIANALSRVTLNVMEVMPDRTMQPSTNPEAIAALDALFYGETGQSQMMHTFGIHLTTPGESYLVGVPPADGGDMAVDDNWRVLSNKELRQEGSKWIIDRGDGQEEKYEDGSNPERPAEALVIRIWRPHPAKWVEATSPVRAALPILRELEGLTKHVAATIDSRLAGAGLLLMPKEAVFETPLNPDGPDPADGANLDSFMQELIAAMVTPIGDRSSAAAVVPPVIRMPGELIEKVQHIKFWSEFSEKVLELIDAKIHRLALSMDMPPEELTGKGDMNHWGGWLATEDGIKLHIEPLCNLICDALTQKYLWPSLLPPGTDPDEPIPDEVRRQVIVADTSDLRQRPERSSEAVALHGSMVLTDKALVRETGFEDSDLLAPGSDEWRRRVLTQIAAGPLPDLALAAIKALGLNIEPESAAAPAPGVGEVTAIGTAPPAPVPAIEAPRNPPAPAGPQAVAASGTALCDLPARAAATVAAAAVEGVLAEHGYDTRSRDALLASADLLVARAMERAHARLFGRGKGRQRPITDEAKLSHALMDAWTRVPSTARLVGVDPAQLTDACDRYTRELLARGMDHNPDLLAAVLDKAVLGG